MTIKAIIVDDELLMRRSILRFLKAHPAVEVIAECGDGVSAVQAVRRHAPDVIFLDIELPGLNGLQVMSEIGIDMMPLTVFVTAYAEYAVRAFEGRAIDYLLKPFGQQRLDEALSRIKERLALKASISTQIQPPAKPGALEYLERIPVNHRGRISLINVADVDWAEAEKNYVLLHLGMRVFVLRRTLRSLEHCLNPRQFVRIHRSTIVNAQKISEIRPWLNGYHMVVLNTGQQLRMSRYQRGGARLLLGKSH
jgi:two-component system LytT family response regulator